MPSFPSDPSSESDPSVFATKHIDLDWTIDFKTESIHGHVVLHVKRLIPDARVLFLDATSLEIKFVSLADDGTPVPFEYNPEGGKFGGELAIQVPDEEELKIKIQYSTLLGGTAVQWLKPEQTQGGQHPFLFSQCQAINARSLLPCQDTPCIKATYSAVVRVPTPLTVVMSANERKVLSSEVDYEIVEFKQTLPIPSYLIAIAAGELASKPLSSRCAVWSEPALIEQAAWEFEATEDCLKIAESIAGPYRWGRYDILILPPSFPYGGMENPCLTFLTPSLLAGDRSLVNVVAHEIAHSWTGNLVTNVNWEHFWLNEGFTTFLERKIIAEIEGGEPARHLHALVGLGELTKALDDYGPGAEGARLVPDLSTTNPDDVFSVVPYEKGHTLLMQIEEIVGGVEAMNEYLRAYISKFADASPLDTDEWKAFLFEFFQSKPEIVSKLQAIDWDAWFKGTGQPPYIPKYDDSQFNAVIQFAEAFYRQEKIEHDLFNDSFNVNQKLLFLDVLRTHAPKDKLDLFFFKNIDEKYNLSACKNVEILYRWLQLCLENDYIVVIPTAAEFATKHGRMKYCRPIYKLLCRTEVGRQIAVDTFQKHRSFYHPVAAKMIAKDLGLAE